MAQWIIIYIKCKKLMFKKEIYIQINAKKETRLKKFKITTMVKIKNYHYGNANPLLHNDELYNNVINFLSRFFLNISFF